MNIVRTSVPQLANETEGVLTEMKNLLLSRGDWDIRRRKPTQLMDLLDFFIDPNNPYPLTRLATDEGWQRYILPSAITNLYGEDGRGPPPSSDRVVTLNPRNGLGENELCTNLIVTMKTCNEDVTPKKDEGEDGEDFAGVMTPLRSFFAHRNPHPKDHQVRHAQPVYSDESICREEEEEEEVDWINRRRWLEAMLNPEAM